MVNFRWAQLVCTGALVVGCSWFASSQSGGASAAGVSSARCLSVRVEASQSANGGGALQVLIRKTTKGDYPRLDYEDLVESLAIESDPETLEWLVVVPGTREEASVPWPADGSIGVYFLFSKPGLHWRHLLEPSTGTIEFRVDGNETIVARVSPHAGECHAAS